MNKFKNVIVTTTISPSMISESEQNIIIREISERKFKELIKTKFISAVGHETTANILSKKFNKKIEFKRENIAIDSSTLIISAIPQFRVDKSREFTKEEIMSAKFRYFIAYTISIDEIDKTVSTSSDVFSASCVYNMITGGI